MKRLLSSGVFFFQKILFYPFIFTFTLFNIIAPFLTLLHDWHYLTGIFSLEFLCTLVMFGFLQSSMFISCFTVYAYRMCFVGARYGHFPVMLAQINVSKFTPTPSLVFLNILSLIMLCTSDIYALITYSTFVESFFILLSVSGILWLRYKKPDIPRPIKVSVLIPIFFIVICLFLVFLPIYYKPLEVVVALFITLTGVPAYYIGVTWTNKPLWFHRGHVALTHFVQKLFMSAKEHVEEEE